MLKILFLFSAVLLLAGCTSSQLAGTTATDILAPALAAVGGGAGAYATNDDDAATQAGAAVAGVVGGYLLGEFINKGFKEEKAKEFKYGYDLGRANATKGLYWTYQHLHKLENAPPQRQRIYRIPAVYRNDGINRVASDIYLPVVE